MLLFVAGFEHVDIKGMLKYKKVSITLSAVSSFIPMAGVVLWSLSMGYPIETSLMLGIALSATSMGITVRSLLDCNQINSKPGRTILGSLVINDITGLIMMTIVIGVIASTSGNLFFDIVYVVAGIGIFFLIFLAAEYLMPYIILYAVRFRVEEAQFTLVFVVVLLAAYFANNLGLSTMIGAFFAGIALSRSSILETETFSQKISSISYGLFIPIFFVMAGARIDLSNIAQSLGLAVMMLCVITSLQIGCAFLVGKFFKYGNWKSVLMGLGMLPYGEVTLIVMTALLTLAAGNEDKFGGLLGQEGLQSLFSAVLILIAMTVLIAPVAMKYVSRKIQDEEDRKNR
jgi:Kef-type K+ transport system membrane component KefB